MKLPSSERAIADLSKLLEYSLNASHFWGRHKARVFRSALGITAQHAQSLREAVLQAAIAGEAKPSHRDEYGQRYMVPSVEGASRRSCCAKLLCEVVGSYQPARIFLDLRIVTCGRRVVVAPKMFDVIALLEDLPDERLVRGQVSTIVEVLAPNVFEVDFSDEQGQSYASLGLRSDQFLVLRTNQVAAA